MTRTAPFTPDEVQSLNAFQGSGCFHPFTCGNDSGHPDLVATESGWSCLACDYRQEWAHAFQADWSWRRHADGLAAVTSMAARDSFGRVVRGAWIAWAKTQPNPKPSWLVPYDELSEPDKEADRQIAEAVLNGINIRRVFLALKKSRAELSEHEAAEFEALQDGFFASLDVKHPRPSLPVADLDAIERRLGEAS